MIRSIPAAVTMVAVVLAPALAGADPAPVPPPAAAPASNAIYRIDLAVTGLDADPKAPPLQMSLRLPERQHGSVESEENIPLGNGATTSRQNVGVKLSMSYELTGKTLALVGELELSSVENRMPAGQVVKRLRTNIATHVTPGAPVTFATLTDLSTHARYTITVAATPAS
jgi:hypothetical protein